MAYQETEEDFTNAERYLEKDGSGAIDSEELRRNLEAAIKARADPRGAEVQIAPQDSLEVQTKKRTSKKRKCANCTCGRSKNKSLDADKGAGANGCGETKDKLPKSGCGSCYLGDAFRCDGCPYKGMPAFKEGEEFKFDDRLNDL